MKMLRVVFSLLLPGFFGAALGAIAGPLIGGAISGGSGPSTSGGSGYYIPTGLLNADQQWQNELGQQQNAQGSIYANMPWYQQSLNAGGAANALYGGQYQNAANNAGTQYGALGTNLQNAAGMQFGQQQPLISAGQQLYNTALDPQHALYSRTVQQLQDQTGATNSMYGLGSSAAGAGVANQALSNFNIDWQNQQLQRQAQGLQGYGQAVQQAGQAGAQGGALGAAGAGYTQQGGEIPFQAGQYLAGIPGQLAGQYASGVEQGPLSSSQAINGQIIPYLNYGQGAQSIPYQSQSQGAGALGALASQGISSLGSNPQVQSGLSSVFGNFFGGGGSGSTLFGPASTGNYFGGGSSPYYSGSNTYGFTM